MSLIVDMDGSREDQSIRRVEWGPIEVLEIVKKRLIIHM